MLGNLKERRERMETPTDHKQELIQQVMMGDVEHGISTILFRHAAGKALGVNATDMSCLAVIFFRGLATPAELSQYTGLSSGATTAMLIRLEKRGLIERRRNPKDRRGRFVAIAQAAMEKVAPLYEPTERAERDLIASYSEKELELFSNFFRRLETVWWEGRKRLQQASGEGDR
jgi:DNA-binding MarR family transcriptional regulator